MSGYEIGKECPSYIDKEGVITFSCETVTFHEMKFYDGIKSGTEKFKMVVDDESYYGRALFFHRSWVGNAIDNISRPVIYIPDNIVEEDSDGNVGYQLTCTPLYECIFPSVGINATGDAQLTWWSNTKSVILPNEKTGKYVYDITNIKKFYANDYSNLDENLNVSKILCSAPIYWEVLKCGNLDIKAYRTPVIRHVSIIKCISNEGYILDFVAESGGGSMRIHNHTNTMEGGFAAAVFMPSAVPRPMSWM